MLCNLFGTRRQDRRPTPAPRTRLSVGSLDDRLLPSSTSVLINEVLVNPPGKPDAPMEYIELRVMAGASLSDLYVVALEGEQPGTGTADPGTVDYALDLSSYQTAFNNKFGAGNEGLILITGAGHGYSAASSTALVIEDPALSGPDAGLENGSSSYVTLHSTGIIAVDDDLDGNNDGTLDSIVGVTYVDGVGFKESPTSSDFVYGYNVTPSSGQDPDVILRDKDNTLEHFQGGGAGPAVWYAGELTGSRDSNGNWVIDPTFGSLPAGTKTTAGAANPV